MWRPVRRFRFNTKHVKFYQAPINWSKNFQLATLNYISNYDCTYELRRESNIFSLWYKINYYSGIIENISSSKVITSTSKIKKLICRACALWSSKLSGTQSTVVTLLSCDQSTEEIFPGGTPARTKKNTTVELISVWFIFFIYSRFNQRYIYPCGSLSKRGIPWTLRFHLRTLQRRNGLLTDARRSLRSHWMHEERIRAVFRGIPDPSIIRLKLNNQR